MFDEAIKLAAQLMAISAKTAPKTSGLDYLEIKIIVGEDLVKLGEAMTRYGRERRSLVPESKGKNVMYTADIFEQAYARDGENVKNAAALLLIGLRKGSASADSNCGGCGIELCAQRRVKKGAEFDGPQCGFRLLDMGIAIGSAVKTASILNIDNRIFGTAGTVAKRIGMVDCDWVVGIPLSATGKNIFTDRLELTQMLVNI